MVMLSSIGIEDLALLSSSDLDMTSYCCSHFKIAAWKLRWCRLSSFSFLQILLRLLRIETCRLSKIISLRALLSKMFSPCRASVSNFPAFWVAVMFDDYVKFEKIVSVSAMPSSVGFFFNNLFTNCRYVVQYLVLLIADPLCNFLTQSELRWAFSIANTVLFIEKWNSPVAPTSCTSLVSHAPT